MKKLWDGIQNIIEFISAILILVMIALLFANSISRYLFDYSFAWCEEICRFFLIAIVFLGINIAIKKQVLLKIDILETSLHGNSLARLLKIALAILAVVTQIFFTYSGFCYLIEAGMLSKSSALAIPMWCVYLVVPFGYLFAICQELIELAKSVKTMNAKEES